jgi:processive 1,2-diacylglycerol beta-glucosyltransferase
MAKKRIILMYISEVSGHHSATLAIEKAIRYLDKEVDIFNMNIFHYTNPLSERIVNRLYMGAIKRFPWIWEYLYDNTRVKKIIDYFKIIVHRTNIPKLRILFEKIKPQVIICSQAYPCGMVADYKRFYNADFKLIAVLTDYIPHSYWIYENIDYYVVPSKEIEQKLISKGVANEKIRILGIPVDPYFSEVLQKEKIIEKLALTYHLPKILIMGGGQGLGPIENIVETLQKIDIDLEILVVTGINKKLYYRLKRKISTFKQKVILFGFVNNIAELMTVSDVIITKPGGITTAEALSKGLPMIIVEPIPGQEMSNTEYLISKGAAVMIEKPQKIKDVLKEMLINRERLNKMRQAAKEISKPNASIEIANLALKLIK